MRNIIILLFLMNFTILLAQEDGYKDIEIAMKWIDKGKRLNGAISLLTNAKNNIKFGWCGNEEAEVSWRISYETARAYLLKQKYDKALQKIEQIKNCDFGGNCQESDSLKLKILTQIHGVKKLKNEIENSYEGSYKQEKYLYLKELKYRLKLAGAETKMYWTPAKDWSLKKYLLETNYYKEIMKEQPH